MKRRQVITGFLGLTAATMVSRWGITPEADQLHSVAGVIERDNDFSYMSVSFDELDPVSDREQPVLLTSANDIDERDSQTMSVSKPQAPVAAQIVEQQQNLQVHNDSKQEEKTSKVDEPLQVPVATEVKPSNKIIAAINKNVDFARDYSDDIFVSDHEQVLLQSVFLRLKNLQKTIGFGNFNLVSFDEALTYAKRFSAIGEFSPQELAFIEKVFFTDAANYGFYGSKVTEKLTTRFNKSDTVKIPASGHYIFKNESLAYYKKLKRDVGDSIILTSGIRSNVKQLYLFLAKTVRVKGNLSRASRSLAPPGYSYHGIGDFDVGRIGWGGKNFTDDFANTNEYKRMQDLGYIAIRYDHGNQLGVRFEPWHIKVV